jgi:hypothetical protein
MRRGEVYTMRSTTPPSIVRDVVLPSKRLRPRSSMVTCWAYVRSRLKSG